MEQSTDGYDNPQTLMAETIALLRKDPRSLLDIHKESGVPFYWLKKFSAGEIPNPAVNRTQYLYEYLSGKKLFS
jgi:hypothetical protein